MTSEASNCDGGYKRPTWSKGTEFLMSCISLSVGLGNIWRWADLKNIKFNYTDTCKRFPFTAFENGGATFIFVYIIILFLIGKPFYFLEMIIGQFTSSGSIKALEIVPLMKGRVCWNENSQITLAFLSHRCRIWSANCVCHNHKLLQFNYCADTLLPRSIISKHFAMDSMSWKLQLHMCAFKYQSKIQQLVTKQHRNLLLVSMKFVRLTDSLSIDWFSAMKSYDRRTTFLMELGFQIGDYRYVSLSHGCVSFCQSSKASRAQESSHISSPSFPTSSSSLCSFAPPHLKDQSTVSFTLSNPICQKCSIRLYGTMPSFSYFFHSHSAPEPCWCIPVTTNSIGTSTGESVSVPLSAQWFIDYRLLRDAMLVSMIDACTSLLAGFTIFAILGNLAHNLDVEDISKVVRGGHGLAFFSFPEAISKINVWFWPQVSAVHSSCSRLTVSLA